MTENFKFNILKRLICQYEFIFSYINLRIVFCSYAASKFELILFTASPSMYAKRVLDHIDPEHRLFDHKLYREYCHHHQVRSE